MQRNYPPDEDIEASKFDRLPGPPPVTRTYLTREQQQQPVRYELRQQQAPMSAIRRASSVESIPEPGQRRAFLCAIPAAIIIAIGIGLTLLLVFLP